MTIEWNPSAGPTLGVEWEVQLIDAETRLLRQDASAVLADLPGLLESGEHPKMRHELMQSTIEVVTGICGTVAEAKADLALSLKDLQRAAEAHGIVLASAGTHAISHWRDGKMAPEPALRRACPGDPVPLPQGANHGRTRAHWVARRAPCDAGD
jgi:carboxylate-amine ligase